MAAVITKERPILFSGPMVRAIIEGRKSQTRRVIKPQPPSDDIGFGVYEPTVCDRNGEEFPGPEIFGCYDNDGEWGVKCPYGKPGDELWVRETFCILDRDHWADGSRPRDWMYCTNRPRRNACAYSAETDSDGNEIRKQYGYKWKPSIHMPSWASRLSLEITGIRVERLQDISAKDILAEGAVERPHQCEYLGKCPVSAFDGKVYPDLKSLWAAGWDDINGKTHPWDSNPWVWVIEFKRV